ncbi:8657_t:CDS:1 [Acaulospora morrowiae]|uniref:8657_t:CDS:1 n=1 Tax=Acaulospora morrowiae TaxID=94023 RepID=A0A9N8YYP4_9GLOM|nr:8657_t:CDS:1 [Acaulospora morrowiae]
MSNVMCQREFFNFTSTYPSHQLRFSPSAAVHDSHSLHPTSPSGLPNVLPPHLSVSRHPSPTKLPDPKIIQQVISEIDPMTHLKILSQLKVPIEELICPTTKSRKSGGGVPRPQNLFVIYRRDVQAKLTAKFGSEIGSHLPFVSREASERWKLEPQEIRSIYEFIADLAKKVHDLTYPNYVYKPRKRALKSALSNSIFNDEMYHLAGQRYKDLNGDSLRTNGNGQVALGNYNTHPLNSHTTFANNRHNSQRHGSTSNVHGTFQLPHNGHDCSNLDNDDRYHHMSSAQCQRPHPSPPRFHPVDARASAVNSQRNIYDYHEPPREECATDNADDLSPFSCTYDKSNSTSNYTYPSPTTTHNSFTQSSTVKDQSHPPSRSTSFASPSTGVYSPTLSRRESFTSSDPDQESFEDLKTMDSGNYISRDEGSIEEVRHDGRPVTNESSYGRGKNDRDSEYFSMPYHSHFQSHSSNFAANVIPQRECDAAPLLPPLNTFLTSRNGASAIITSRSDEGDDNNYDRKICRSFGGPV